ncbi:hypothetical protein LXL04_030460 [Taraxacum kok-saghyz]
MHLAMKIRRSTLQLLLSRLSRCRGLLKSLHKTPEIESRLCDGNLCSSGVQGSPLTNYGVEIWYCVTRMPGIFLIARETTYCTTTFSYSVIMEQQAYSLHSKKIIFLLKKVQFLTHRFYLAFA